MRFLSHRADSAFPYGRHLWSVSSLWADHHVSSPIRPASKRRSAMAARACNSASTTGDLATSDVIDSSGICCWQLKHSDERFGTAPKTRSWPAASDCQPGGEYAAILGCIRNSWASERPGGRFRHAAKPITPHSRRAGSPQHDAWRRFSHEHRFVIPPPGNIPARTRSSRSPLHSCYPASACAWGSFAQPGWQERSCGPRLPPASIHRTQHRGVACPAWHQFHPSGICRVVHARVYRTRRLPPERLPSRFAERLDHMDGNCGDARP